MFLQLLKFLFLGNRYSDRSAACSFHSWTSCSLSWFSYIRNLFLPLLNSENLTLFLATPLYLQSVPSNPEHFVPWHSDISIGFSYFVLWHILVDLYPVYFTHEQCFLDFECICNIQNLCSFPCRFICILKLVLGKNVCSFVLPVFLPFVNHTFRA
jgi:hypothetical protein